MLSIQSESVIKTKVFNQHSGFKVRAIQAIYIWQLHTAFTELLGASDKS